MGKSVTGIRLAAAALLLLAPLLSHAAGLGRLTVTSPLGQPLSAEIEIVSLQPGEEESLSARLASSEAFKQAGMEMSSSLIGLQLTIERRAGKPFVRLRSKQAINDPFLDVLIELQWATGRLVREYTFLLDPPEYKKPAPPVAAAPQVAPRAEPTPAPAASRIESRPISAAPAAPTGKPAGTHEVKKGDTLGAIARANRPEGVTLNQMLVALYRANQDAFINGNINLIRAGRILAIPDREGISAVDQADANGLVKSQMAEFAAYRQKLAGIVAASPATVAPAAREATGRIGPKPEAPAAAEPKDQLRLSKADPAKPGAPEAKAAREDDRVARERALKDQQSRIGELEKNVSDLQKLVELKNQQLAALEQKAAAKPAPAPVAPAKPEPAKAEPAKPAAEAPKPAPEPAKPAAEPAKPEPPKAAEPVKAAEAVKAPEAKPAPDAKKAKAPAKAPPPPPEPDLVDEFMNFVTDPVSGGGLAGVLALLFGYGAWAWKKKKAGQSSQFQDSVLGAASGGAAGSVFGAGEAPGATAEAAAPPAASVSEAASVSDAPSVGAAESDEVDPIAEADVYMAYGRNAQAEEILKEALAKDASRVPVHAKLLEIYASQRDAKAFEQTALKVKSLTGSSGPDWDKAMALGHSIDPSNGLYGAGAVAAMAAASAPAAAAPALDFDIGGGAEQTPQAAASETAAPLDFDLGGGEKTDFAPGGTLVLDSGETKSASSSGLDFDLDKTIVGGLNLGAMPKAEAARPEADPDATVAMDFDLNLDLGGDKAEDAKAQTGGGNLDIGSLSLDIGGAGGGDAKWQELATKLDLAKAYEEMGDKDGARELLNEVVKDGDAAQQAQAKQMLGSLG